MHQISIPPRQGTALKLRSGERLRVTSPDGGQVADLVAFAGTEWFSAGRTIDYNGCIYLSTGSTLYSNRGSAMLEIVEDAAGRHDLLLAPCSQHMFEKLHGVVGPHPGCFENLIAALAGYGIAPDAIPSAFNVFMNVTVDAGTGVIAIGPPSCRAGDHIDFVATTDLVVGVTACAAEQTNAGSFSRIDLEIHPAHVPA